MIGHEPGGRHIVIFSVVVHPEYQSRGFAGKLLVRFISRMAEMKRTSIHLICRDSLVGFYGKYGFEYMGASTSTHGGLRWHEMALQL